VERDICPLLRKLLRYVSGFS